jgi:hypothetical protein
VTAEVLKAAAWLAYAAALGLAFKHAQHVRGREIGLYDPLPRWLIAVTVVATIALVFAIIAANLYGKR